MVTQPIPTARSILNKEQLINILYNRRAKMVTQIRAKPKPHTYLLIYQYITN